MPVVGPQVATSHVAARLALDGDAELVAGLALSVDDVSQVGGTRPAPFSEELAVGAWDACEKGFELVHAAIIHRMVYGDQHLLVYFTIWFTVV